MTLLGKNDEATHKSMSARLRRLRDEFEPHYDDPSTADVPEAPAPPPSREGELLFVAGPRAGERLSIEGRAVALDRDGNESGGEGASSLVVRIWTQADNIISQARCALCGQGVYIDPKHGRITCSGCNQYTDCCICDDPVLQGR